MSPSTMFMLALVEVLGGSVAFYVMGRILLPEMGLTAPNLGIWFIVFAIFTAWQVIKTALNTAAS